MSDTNTEKANRDDLLRMVTDVVAAYVSKNAVPATQLSDLINTVYGSLCSLEGGQSEAKSEAPKPAIAVKKSVDAGLHYLS